MMSEADGSKNRSQCVREYLKSHPRAKNKAVAEALAEQGIEVKMHYVGEIRRKAKLKRARKSGAKRTPKSSTRGRPSSNQASFPRHSVEKALRIPKAILDQNAGKPCTIKDAAAFTGVKTSGPFQVEVASATKYGWLDRLEGRRIAPSELAKKVLRPQEANDEIEGFRQAVLQAPSIADVYKQYRGENLPDDKFLQNAVTDKYGVPEDKYAEFKVVLIESLETAGLLDRRGDKLRVIDVSAEEISSDDVTRRIRKLGKSVVLTSSDTCFVVQPFNPPFGDYYDKVYRPAIEKAGLTAMRADADIFGTGKIMDQIWSGIKAAKVLVAEMTSRNPNVFYELGLAHALNKPVVLVSSNENDVPFDLQHIRVIYYDVNDPFWGNKLMDKVAENILSAIENPKEATLQGVADPA